MQNNQLKSEDASASKRKERRIVTWTPEEDEILREQINIHGSESWTAIASKFKDKSTRQCRRRWYTYLNSDFKKGGWSPEEDMLLCEAQKLYGNKWTEIAKVVSGRTDNAVKNRFTTLCKKRAKREAIAKENSNAYMTRNNKRVIIENVLHSESLFKRMRREHIPNLVGIVDNSEFILKDCGTAKQQQLRSPFAVLAQNRHKGDNLLPQEQVPVDGDKKIEGTFLKKDDPKVAALMQQAELLSSLAVKVNTETTEQSLENAWKVLQNFLNRSKDSKGLTSEISDMDIQLDDLKDFMEDLKSSKLDDPKDLSQDLKSSTQEAGPSPRQPDLYDSPSSSDYSTGSTLSAAANQQMEGTQAEICMENIDLVAELESIEMEDEDQVNMRENAGLPGITKDQGVQIVPSDETENNAPVVSAPLTMDFCSPLQVTPLFRSVAATIPSPQFSESERHFLMKTFGIESPPLDGSSNPSQPPQCRRALVHSL